MRANELALAANKRRLAVADASRKAVQLGEDAEEITQRTADAAALAALRALRASSHDAELAPEKWRKAVEVAKVVGAAIAGLLALLAALGQGLGLLK